jgi:hypothetical protein
MALNYKKLLGAQPHQMMQDDVMTVILISTFNSAKAVVVNVNIE